jgi:ubiquinone/menaquinone biosynthesis C-methylase UbiE
VADERYVPAAGRPIFTRLYDPVVRITMREGAWRPGLVDAVMDGHPRSVLEVGCGTGTLTVALEQAAPDTRLVGVDGDPEALGIARGKAAPGSSIEWVEGLAQELPFADGEFERVVTSLVIHHLVPESKRRALIEMRRVLTPGGRLHVADFGKPHDLLMRAIFRANVQTFDGMENTRDHAAGRLPAYIEEAGFTDVRVQKRLRTAAGSLELITANTP